jgi:hypothetical protein
MKDKIKTTNTERWTDEQFEASANTALDWLLAQLPDVVADMSPEEAITVTVDDDSYSYSLMSKAGLRIGHDVDDEAFEIEARTVEGKVRATSWPSLPVVLMRNDPGGPWLRFAELGFAPGGLSHGGDA